MPALEPQPRLVAEPLALAAAPKAMSFVPIAGWGNQLISLANALFIATQLGRSIVVPLATKQNDVADPDSVCNSKEMVHMVPHPIDASIVIGRYDKLAALDDRPLVSAFLDTSLWPVPALSAAPACGASCMVVNDTCEEVPFVLNKTIPSLKVGAPARAALLRFASTFTLPDAGRTWHNTTLLQPTDVVGCKIRYLPALVKRVRALLPPAYDAVHIRSLNAAHGEGANAAWQTELEPLLASNPTPLYIMADNLTAAIDYALPLAKREVLTYQSLNATNPTAFAAVNKAPKGEFMTGLLVDIIASEYSANFIPAVSTLSEHITELRRCDALAPLSPSPAPEVASAAVADDAMDVATGAKLAAAAEVAQEEGDWVKLRAADEAVDGFFRRLLNSPSAAELAARPKTQEPLAAGDHLLHRLGSSWW